MRLGLRHAVQAVLPIVHGQPAQAPKCTQCTQGNGAQRLAQAGAALKLCCRRAAGTGCTARPCLAVQLQICAFAALLPFPNFRLPPLHFAMTVQTLLKMGDARLLRVARPVPVFDTAALHQLVQDLHDTMHAAHGAGLAAPQIGQDWQVVVFGSNVPNPRYPDRPLVPHTVLVNPVVEPLGDAQEEDWEGCLSVPGLRGRVPRWTRVRYRGFDPQGAPIDRVAEGFHARVVQHECDHLLGKLYPMRMRDLPQLGFTEVLFPGLEPADDD